jgi:hypothetical protein
VPNELLLDIKRLAETETGDESLLTDVFDLFAKEPDSPLIGMMSPATKVRNKLSRVTFNAAVSSVMDVFAMPDSKNVYRVLSGYLQVWVEHLQSLSGAQWLTNPILFRAALLLFRDVAQRVSDRHGATFTVENFREALEPLFKKATKSTFSKPGHSHKALFETFQKLIRKQFTIAGS